MEFPDFGHRHTVLVVDDEPKIRAIITTILSADDYDTLTAENANAALDILGVEIPCLVLCDVNMPGMSGFELCQKIRATRQTSHVPVALITGLVDDEALERGMAAGAADYVKKPFSRAELRLRVKNLIDYHERFRKHQHLFDTATQGILAATAQNGKFVMANPAVCRMLEYDTQTLLSLRTDDIHPDAYKEENRPGFDAHSLGERNVAYGVPLLTKGGNTIYADISTSLLTIDGELCTVGFLTDVTERVEYEKRVEQDERQLKSMETELRLAQKMEAVGRLASGIAHEINTPTQFVGDNTRFLKDAFQSLGELLNAYRRLVSVAEIRESAEALREQCKALEEEADIEYLLDEIPKAVEQSLDGVGRIAHIVRAMKEFAHPGGTEKICTNINKLIETTVTVSKNEWKYCADVKVRPAPNLPPVSCLPGEISQVLLNLIVNAAHAIYDRFGNEKKGTIAIDTFPSRDEIEIRIADNGTGIPSDIRDKIMDPFFTTKEVGRGTGQGLAIARSVIVDKHGGAFFFDSEVGKGTTFIIRLPNRTEQLELRESAHESSDKPHRARRD